MKLLFPKIVDIFDTAGRTERMMPNIKKPGVPKMFDILEMSYDAKDLGFYDKKHLFALGEEQNFFEPGEGKTIITVKGWRVCPLICYDLRFPELFRLQKKSNVEILVIPSAFTEQTGKVHWETLVKARAIENLCYVVTACQGGYHLSLIHI